jgi:hypothetical protein
MDSSHATYAVASDGAALEWLRSMVMGVWLAPGMCAPANIQERDDYAQAPSY